MVQLASKYQAREKISDYWVSEKLDGIRGYWNGKTLLTRNGNTLHSPTWFTQGWPKRAIDGELWLGRDKFQQTSSCVLAKSKNDCWKKVKFMMFDLPKHSGTFSQRVQAMKKLMHASQSQYLEMIRQEKLPNEKALYKSLSQVVSQKGEGLMLHYQDAYYQQGRSNHLMKLKQFQDAEAKVIKHLQGQGKYRQMLGSLLVETEQGLQFKIGSGFSDKERKNPPAIGSTITYKYFGTTQKGIPRFASFMRIRAE